VPGLGGTTNSPNGNKCEQNNAKKWKHNLEKCGQSNARKRMEAGKLHPTTGNKVRPKNARKRMEAGKSHPTATKGDQSNARKKKWQQ
jgi:hypothetical protein